MIMIKYRGEVSYVISYPLLWIARKSYRIQRIQKHFSQADFVLSCLMMHPVRRKCYIFSHVLEMHYCYFQKDICLLQTAVYVY